MINLLYVDLFCGAGGTSTGVELGPCKRRAVREGSCMCES